MGHNNYKQRYTTFITYNAYNNNHLHNSNTIQPENWHEYNKRMIFMVNNYITNKQQQNNILTWIEHNMIC